MKIKKIFILILTVSLGFYSCEKDDICAAETPTTPQFVIEFLNDQQNAVAVPNKLKIQNSDNLKELTFVAGSKIKLPLNTEKDSTKYSLTVNTGVVGENKDDIVFNYVRNSIYISRACGYKILFTLTANQTILIPETPAVNNWIKRIVITKLNIINEDETHIKIYF